MEMPWARGVEAVDISPPALEVARANAARLQLDHRYHLSAAAICSRGAPGADAYDFVVSNPPYVPESEPEQAQREVREFEPSKMAVFAGENGLEVYRRLAPQARAALKPSGWLVGRDWTFPHGHHARTGEGLRRPPRGAGHAGLCRGISAGGRGGEDSRLVQKAKKEQGPSNSDRDSALRSSLGMTELQN